MTDKNVDLIEVGRGNQSKVIGQGNSISEYGATVMSLLLFVGQGAIYVWLALWAILYFSDVLFLWAMGISFVISVALTVLAVWVIVKLIMVLHKMNEPTRIRDERGRFARETPVYSGGVRKGTIRTAENGQSEYITQWGGGGDK